MRRLEWLGYHLCRLLLGGIFLYAGSLKTADIVGFASSVAAYQLLPYSWNYLVASTLPYLEILTGFLLVINARIRPAVLVIGGLNLVFMAALVSVIVRGLDIDCGCFDPAGGKTTTATAALVRDLGIMALVVVTWWLRSRRVGRPLDRSTFVE